MKNIKEQSHINKGRTYTETEGMSLPQLAEEQWQAIITNDGTYDGKFIYAVTTTGIFCRPACKSRPPRKENVCIFQNAEQAAASGFRPCKRCKPTGQRLPDEEWVEQITQYIETHYSDTLTLAVLADMCHGSPYHLQRTFKRIKGLSPIEYAQHIRITKAAAYLQHTDRSVSEVARLAGIPNIPYFITLFKKKTGHTPTEYRKQNEK
ncbi:bifunctional transcriptional activator/DNA repair enzyme AdaA [Paenibacillus taiwanensis]|uniref:bifunctional transcriptional activator/DNA repair enzyme AdaA n=1 Tax=Paenibacillus taiwanensis TaxID=401638 RepID=UPI00056D97F6|nr:bifunctional transcriptional activator/DNA repair enzyme AdaA [Paenibacillus taiwanensis]